LIWSNYVRKLKYNNMLVMTIMEFWCCWSAKQLLSLLLLIRYLNVVLALLNTIALWLPITITQYYKPKKVFGHFRILIGIINYRKRPYRSPTRKVIIFQTHFNHNDCNNNILKDDVDHLYFNVDPERSIIGKHLVYIRF